ncbi:MAG: hypothetical protein HKP55_05040 [Gammaproteobacteria bacterium]|nr:hypothetical protein [Gammaproteobacteria bacterium]
MIKNHITTIVSGFAIVILLMIVVLSLVFFESQSIKDVLLQIGSNNNKANLLTIIRESQLERSVILRDIYLTGDPFEKDDLKMNFYNHATKVGNAYKSLQSLELSPAERKKLQYFIEITRVNRDIRNEIIDILVKDKANIDILDLNNKFSKTIELEKASQGLLRGLKTNIDNKITMDIEEVISTIKTIVFNHLVLIISSVLLSLTIAFWVVRLVVKQTKVIESFHDRLEEKVIARTEELAFAKDVAENANKEKSRFLANMSHELRTPMHAILSFSRLASKKVEDEKVKNYLSKIDQSGKRLTNLIDALLDISKLESGKMDFNFQLSDMVSIVDNAVSELKSVSIDKNLTVIFEESAPVELEMDSNLITQVMINLLSNAIKFSPEKSKIIISLIEVDAVPGTDFYGTVELIITDNGIGIPAEELSKVFERFIQSSKTVTKAGGTGLGLPICREIIQGHNGLIWAESPVNGSGNGSSFHFIIPKKQN